MIWSSSTDSRQSIYLLLNKNKNKNCIDDIFKFKDMQDFHDVGAWVKIVL